MESFLFLQVGSGAARSPRSLAFASVTVREAATSWAHGDGYSGCARQGADLIGAAAANWQGSAMPGSAEPPRHDHHGPAPLERDEGTSSTLRSTTSTTWAASTVGTPSSPRSSRSVTMLFGRLEAPGAPRWADGAVGERRWWERGVSGCAASGSTHCTTSCSWELVPVRVCVLAAC